MYALIANGVVLQISNTKFEVHPSILFVEVPNDVQAGWLWDETSKSASPPPEPAPPSLEEKQAAIVNAVQARLDAFAQTRNYDSIFTAATYATSKNPVFAIEGQYALEARDATWAKCYEILNAFLAGDIAEPTLQEIMAQLPILEWPVVTNE